MKLFQSILMPTLLNINIAAFAANNTQTILPLEFNTGNPSPNGLPSTVIDIQGHKIPLIFDTGDKKSGISLGQYALHGINVKFTGKEICSKTMDGQMCRKEFILPEVKLGSIAIKNVTSTTMDKLWDSGANSGFKETEASKNGVIGFKLLSQFNFLLDYKHSRVILVKRGENPLGYEIKNWQSIPFTGALETNLLINKRNLKIGWDTGSVPSIIKENLVINLEHKPCPTYKSNCSSVSPIIFTEDGRYLPATWFETRAIPSYAPDGLIGSNFYKNNLVYFDFDHNLIDIKPY